MSEARYVAAGFLDVGTQPRIQLAGRGHPRLTLQYRVVERQALLAGPTMNIVEHIDGGRHGPVQRQPAGHTHPRHRDGRRLRAMIDRRHQGGLE
ncbi:hypothetical protein CDEF62S_01317 [Castellaniella defragrans]